MANHAPALGIDFGTTKSCMAWFNPKTGQAELIRNAEGEEKTPSVVYFGEGETLVGTPALAMLNAGSDERRRVIASVKRELVSAPNLALPGGRRVKPVEVAAEILRKVKRDAEHGHFSETVGRAVVTVPAEFDALERDTIKKAAELAGFVEVELMEEPVAAALAYERAGHGLGNHVLVYDLGGGTFDVAVLARQDDGRFRLALPPEGLHHCGGDLMDRALYDHVDEIAVREHGRLIAPDGRIDLAFLRECCAAKERLSGQERTLVSGYLHSEDGTAIPFRQQIDRETFEALVDTTYVEPTVWLTKQSVDRAAARGLTIDTVVLIGGGSRMPLVQRRLTEVLPVEPRRWDKQDIAVALGAAVAAGERWPPRPRRPTIVVAADGSGNTRTIKEALGLAKDGYLILIRPGIYREGVVMEKDIELVGDGSRDQIVIESDTASPILARSGTAAARGLTLRCKSGQIRNGSGIDIAGGSFQVVDCDVSSNSRACVAIQGRSTVALLSRVAVHNGSESGVWVGDGGKATIEDSDFWGNGHAGIAVQGAAATLRNNRIHDGMGSGVWVDRGGQVTMEGNEIWGNDHAGVGVKAGDATLLDNRIHHGKGSGVWIGDGGVARLTGNKIHHNHDAGIWIRSAPDPALSNNEIHDNTLGDLRREA